MRIKKKRKKKNRFINNRRKKKFMIKERKIKKADMKVERNRIREWE